MLRELNRIARRTPENPYLGEAALARVRDMLDAKADRKLRNELKLRHAAGQLVARRSSAGRHRGARGGARAHRRRR